MKCPQCIEEDKKSKVYPEGVFSTAMAGAEWYDEDGNYHRTDPNIYTHHYSCSEGHRFQIIKKQGKEDTIRIQE